MTNTQLITGGAGFIGSCYVLQTRAAGVPVVNLDKLTYCGNLDNLSGLAGDDRHIFVQGDIGNKELVAHLLKTHQPGAVVNFAAESHVDRSIHDPESFVRTNVLGTAALLGAAVEYWKQLSVEEQKKFRFVHVSTDEVFGSLGLTDPAFTETTPYSPRSPYSASKAASDHLVRAFNETYGLPVIITNCSNNYGPRQFPEKLIPLVICNALEGKPLPIYGKGENIRDWLHVEDHCEAVAMALQAGEVGQSYNIGGRSERSNLTVVQTICSILDRLRPRNSGKYQDLIQYVTDRPGHDWRYAMNCSRIERELGWTPRYNFDDGLEMTVKWYLDNQEWVANIQSGNYRHWIDLNYGSRKTR